MEVASNEEGESSQQTSSSEDRPMKKARYVWQIKGKYHSKQPGQEGSQRPEMNLSDSENENEDQSSVPTAQDVIEVREELKKNSIPVPKNNQEEDVVSLPISTMATVVSNLISAFKLSRWQEKNLVKSIDDNLVNNLLEAVGIVDSDVNFNDDYGWQFNDDDNNLEDEAVLMAIHSHGLQNQGSESEDSQSNQCCTENRSLSTPCLCKPTTSSSVEKQVLNPFHKRPATCIPTDMDHQLLSKLQVGQSAPSSHHTRPSNIPNAETTCSIAVTPSSEDLVKTVGLEGMSACEEDKLVSGGRQMRFKSMRVSDISENIICEQQVDESDSSSSPQYNHFDFLDQAVAVAIQKKGLSTLSCSEFG